MPGWATSREAEAEPANDAPARRLDGYGNVRVAKYDKRRTRQQSGVPPGSARQQRHQPVDERVAMLVQIEMPAWEGFDAAGRGRERQPVREFRRRDHGVVLATQDQQRCAQGRSRRSR